MENVIRRLSEKKRRKTLNVKTFFQVIDRGCENLLIFSQFVGAFPSFRECDDAARLEL